MRLNIVFIAAVAMACGPELYRTCQGSDECVEVVPSEVDGVCLDKSAWGFCTWTCEADVECNDDDGLPMVCASFENEDDQYCFPECDEAYPDEPCPAGFACRSTGGGRNNRKVCFPES